MEGAHAVAAEFVAGLVPDSPVAPVTTPEDLAVLGAGLTPGAVGWAVAVGRRCSDATRVAQGEHAAQLTEDDTRRAIEGSMLSLLRRLRGDDSGAVLNEWQLTIARTMARLDWPYERYVLGLRLAQDVALEALLDRAVRWGRADDRPSLLLAVTHGVAGYFDDSVRAVITEFIAERQRAIAQSVAERRRLVAALIGGDEVPADVAAAALGIDLARTTWRWSCGGRERPRAPGRRGRLVQGPAGAGGQPGRGPAARPGDACRAADETLSAVRGDALLCWLTRPVPFAAAYLESLAGLFAARREVHAAVGVPGQGQAGFRRSHLASVDAYRVARAAGRTGVTGYAEVGVLALLSADPERTRWFVAEELGDLAGAGPALGDLRETALCYLDSGRNLMETARRLHVHRNTVVYRLAKVERLLGRPLDERAFATQAALTLATLSGPV